MSLSREKVVASGQPLAFITTLAPSKVPIKKVFTENFMLLVPLASIPAAQERERERVTILKTYFTISQIQYIIVKKEYV